MKKWLPNVHFASEKLECTLYPQTEKEYKNTYLSNVLSIYQCFRPMKSNLNTSSRNYNIVCPPHKRTFFRSNVPKARIISKHIEPHFTNTYRLWYLNWKTLSPQWPDQSLSMFQKEDNKNTRLSQFNGEALSWDIQKPSRTVSKLLQPASHKSN